MRRQDDIPATPPPAAQYRRIDAWWRPGGPRPLIDSSDPAVAQAIGRCLTSRIKLALRNLPSKAFHPRECAWCAYPVEALREAIGYAAFVSRLDIVSGEYGNEEWARFFAGVTPATRELPAEAWQKAAQRRHAAIEQAQYGELE